MNYNIKNILTLLLTTNYFLKPNIKTLLIAIVFILTLILVNNSVCLLVNFFDLLESLVQIQNRIHFLNFWIEKDVTYFALLKYNVDPNDILSLKELLLGKQNSFSKDLLMVLTPVLVSTLLLTGVFIIWLAKTY